MARTGTQAEHRQKNVGVLAMSNVRMAQEIVEQLNAVGVSEFCLCPGGRNSPFVVVLEKTNGIQCTTHFEERSASFFALGRIKNHGRPVAIVTTSGTAAAELLPATIEAYYSGLPLVLVTADRPRRDRGTGAPQAIEQVGLYTKYVTKEWDIANGEALDCSGWEKNFPCHLNVCFDEPLVATHV